MHDPAVTLTARSPPAAVAPGALRAAPAQERFWLLEQLAAGGPSMQAIPICLRIDGAIDRDRLARALRALVAHHAALRSTYRWTSAGLCAEVGGLVAIDEVGSRTTPAHDDASAIGLARELAERPFDLVHGPLLRVRVVADGPERSFLLLVAHHLVWDGWSTSIALRELDALYAAGEDRLPPLEVDYWDYAEAARRWVAGEGGARDLAYWRRRLDGLGTLRPLARIAADRGASPPEVRRLRVALEQRSRDRIARFARERGATPFSVLAAGLQALLLREGMGGESCLGVVVAGRMEQRWERLVGCLANTVALRGSVAGDEPFEAVVERARDAAIEALAHSALPFEAVAEALERRDLMRAPLYQAVLAFESFPRVPARLGAARLLPLDVPLLRGRTEPVVSVAFDGEQPEVRLQWNGELALSPDRLLERWLELVEDGVQRPRAPLAQLGDPSPRRGRPSPAAGPATLPALLRERARQRPDAVALVEEDGETTFGQLIDDADAVARRLRAAGVRPGAPVALAAPRSAAMLTAMLGVLEADCVCVPLDPAHPPDRLRSLLAEVEVALVLCDAPHDTWLGVPARRVDGTGEAQARAVAGIRGDVGWIYFTSGSTGAPKGVLIAHETVVSRLATEPVPWASGDRGCHRTSPGYGDLIQEAFVPLAQGAAAVIAGEDAARDPRLLARLIERHGVTRLLLVPALLDALLALPPDYLARLRALRCCVATGEPLTAALAERCSRLLPEATLVNVYGATECWEVSWHVVPRSIRAGDVVPAGTRRFPGARVVVVDAGGAPVPAGTPGELLVAGPGVARGYHGRPELTAERFVPLPPSSGEAGTAYRTGDVAVLHADGMLEVRGRLDRQVKLRGFRIELEEVERWLRACPEVAEAAVVPRRDGDEIVRGLTAFVVPTEGAEADVHELRRALGRQLPDHCVPTAWLRMRRLPRQAAGKVDRAALAAFAACDPVPLTGSPAPVDASAPGSETERVLTGIWREVLAVERVAPTDDFFDLGGSSLLAVRVMLRIQETLGKEIALRDFYRQPTIAALSASLSRPG